MICYPHYRWVCYILILCCIPITIKVKVPTTKSEERQQNTIMGNDFSSDVGITQEKSCGGDSVVGARDLLDIEELKRKLEDTENAMTKIIARMSQIVPKTQVSYKLIFLLQNDS